MNVLSAIDRAFCSVSKSVFVGITLAVSPLPTMANEPVSMPTASLSLLQVMFGLVIVIGLILCSGWLVRKLNPSVTRGSLLRVVTAASVGQRERVVVVEINNNWLVLGVAPGQVNLLQTMPKAAELPEETLRAAPKFVDKLKEATKRYGRR